MDEDRNGSEFTEFAWKVPIMAAIYYAGTVAAGWLVSATGMSMPEFPGRERSVALGLVASLILAAAVAVLARGLGGTLGFRCLVLFGFTYVSFGVNNQIEGAVYTTASHFETMLLFFIVPCGLLAAAGALMVTPESGGDRLTAVFEDRSPASWWWRVLLAWLAFPLAYFVFGAMAYPFVADSYESDEFGLVVPGPGVIIGAVLLRSLLYLLVTLPILANWSRSRRELVASLAVALTAMVGVVGLVESDWLPTRMRVIHSIEIAADSLIHAWAMVALLVAGNRAEASEPTAATGD